MMADAGTMIPPSPAMPAVLRRHPSFERTALLAVCVAVALLPLLKPAGPGNTAPVDVPMLLAIAGAIVWIGANRLKTAMPYAVPVMMMTAGGALAALTGAALATGAVALGQDLFLLLWAAAIANVARSPDALHRVLRFWSYSAVVTGALLSVAVLTNHPGLAGVNPADGTRAGLTFTDPNLAANYFFVSIMLIWASRPWRSAALRWAAYAILAGALFLTGSNGGMLALAVSISIAVAIGLVRRIGVMATISVVSLSAALGLFAVTHIQLSSIQASARDSGHPGLINSIGRSDQSTSERELLVKEAFRLYQQGDLLGLGPAATRSSLVSADASYANEAHDDYVAALVERGLLGAIGLALLIGAVAVRAWSVVKQRLKPDFAAVIPYPAPLLGALVGVALSGTFYEVLHFRHVWALLGVVAAIYRWGRAAGG